MFYMFFGAAGFNQPLSFDTAKVANVSVYCLTAKKNKILIFYLLINKLIISCLACSETLQSSINHFLSILLRLQL